MFPKSKLTWVLICLLIASYVLYDKEYSQNGIEDDLGITINTVDGESSFLEKPVKKAVENLKSSESGKAFLKALINTNLEKQYGTSDYQVVNSLNNNKIIVSSLKKGEGNEIIHCNSKVKIHSQINIPEQNNIKIDDSKERNLPIDIIIGDKNYISGVELGLIGAKKGDLRKIVIPPSMSKDSDLIPDNKVAVAIIDVLEVKNDQKVPNITNFKNIKDFKGNYAICGKNVKFSYVVVYLKDKKIHKTKRKIHNAILGANKLPLELEQVILGMQEGSIRTTDLKANKLVFDKEIKDLNNELVTIEIELLLVN